MPCIALWNSENVSIKLSTVVDVNVTRKSLGAHSGLSNCVATEPRPRGARMRVNIGHDDSPLIWIRRRHNDAVLITKREINQSKRPLPKLLNVRT